MTEVRIWTPISFILWAKLLTEKEKELFIVASVIIFYELIQLQR